MQLQLTPGLKEGGIGGRGISVFLYESRLFVCVLNPSAAPTQAKGRRNALLYVSFMFIWLDRTGRKGRYTNETDCSSCLRFIRLLFQRVVIIITGLFL